MYFAMDNALYASMDVFDVDECNMLHLFKNVSISDDPHDCDAMLHESLGVVDIYNNNKTQTLKRKCDIFPN